MPIYAADAVNRWLSRYLTAQTQLENSEFSGVCFARAESAASALNEARRVLESAVALSPTQTQLSSSPDDALTRAEDFLTSASNCQLAIDDDLIYGEGELDEILIEGDPTSIAYGAPFDEIEWSGTEQPSSGGAGRVALGALGVGLLGLAGWLAFRGRR